MNKCFALFFVCVALISCTDTELKEQEKQNVLNTDTFTKPPATVTDIDTVPKCVPSPDFLALVKYMDSCSYHIDTSTVSKEAVEFENIKLNREFYATSFIHQLLKDSAVYEDGSRSLASIVYDTKYDINFGKVNCIWTYSWRIPNTEEGLKRRGTVEEWIFDSDSSAQFAYSFLTNEHKKIGFPFCKTPAYYLQCGNSLYMMHSNHTGVAYRHKPFYEWLVKKCIKLRW